MPTERMSVPLASLALGAMLTSPIFDTEFRTTKLVGKDIQITAEILAQLHARGIDTVVVGKRDLAAMRAGEPQGVRKTVGDHAYIRSGLRTPRSRSLEAGLGQYNLSADVEPDADEKVVRQVEHRIDRYDSHTMEHEVRGREKLVSYVDGLFVSMIEGASADAGELDHVCRSSLKSILNDKDLFLCLGLSPMDADYPARHSLHVSTVAISIGVALGLDDQSLLDLGTGCLIHDVGMMKLEPSLVRSKRKLTTKELTRLADHPVLTLDALACPGVWISRVARVVAFQLHERCNGTGYPSGRLRDEIHPLARVAAVADTYVGLVSNRPHRKGMMPYFAIKKLLESVSIGLYDAKALRGLLSAVSLYPIGSHVQTNDGRIARVVRATSNSYMEPIIEFWDDQHRQYEPDLVNLKENNSCQIVRAVASPKRVAA